MVLNWVERPEFLVTVSALGIFPFSSHLGDATGSEKDGGGNPLLSWPCRHPVSAELAGIRSLGDPVGTAWLEKKKKILAQAAPASNQMQQYSDTLAVRIQKSSSIHLALRGK